MFSEELEKIDWDETTRTIALKTEADVRRALSKSQPSPNRIWMLMILWR